MDSGKKRDFVRTALITVVILILALVLLDSMIDNSIQAPKR